MTAHPSVSVGRRTAQISTMKGIQRHRMFVAFVRLPGDREVYRCCGRHQRASGAQRCGEALARRLMRERNPQ